MSRHKALEALEAQLGGPPPSALARLSEHDLQHLTETVKAARRAQAKELRVAGEKAWTHIPWLLRGPIRKIMS